MVYRPFLSGLKDVQKYLSVDLTPGGLAAIQDTVAKTVAAAGPLNTSLVQLADDFEAMGLALASVTPAKAK